MRQSRQNISRDEKISQQNNEHNGTVAIGIVLMSQIGWLASHQGHNPFQKYSKITVDYVGFFVVHMLLEKAFL